VANNQGLMVKGSGHGDDNDFNILNLILARLIKPSPFADPILGLEILAGEFKGVVFSFSKFHVLPVQMMGGFIPTKYETTIHVIPPTLPKDWEPTEAFDSFTSEILFKWLAYIHLNDMSPLLNADTGKTIQ
jgi:hypothetical protein